MTELDDPERLEALRESGLLARTVSARLDHLAFSAARLLAADVAKVNVLDGDFQYTLAGWPPGVYPERETNDTGCREVVMTGVALVVPDAKVHPVTCVMSWNEYFRGYVGVPVSYRGQILGSLCVLTEKPREWRSYEVQALMGLARLVGMSVDLDR